jgi:hypothetical protein
VAVIVSMPLMNLPLDQKPEWSYFRSTASRKRLGLTSSVVLGNSGNLKEFTPGFQMHRTCEDMTQGHEIQNEICCTLDLISF